MYPGGADISRARICGICGMDGMRGGRGDGVPVLVGGDDVYNRA